MSILSLNLTGFNNENKYVKYFIELGENTFIFTVRWSNYCNCAFLSITDDDDNDIVSGVALVNGLKIRHNKLPYVLFFTQINGETYEPTIDNIADEFVIIYDNGEE
jgi:hypothetical protein